MGLIYSSVWQVDGWLTNLCTEVVAAVLVEADWEGAAEDLFADEAVWAELVVGDLLVLDVVALWKEIFHVQYLP